MLKNESGEPLQPYYNNKKSQNLRVYDWYIHVLDTAINTASKNELDFMFFKICFYSF